LMAFYRRVRPSPYLWGPIARKAKDVKPQRDDAYNLLDWICGCVLVYTTLFGVGKIILGSVAEGFAFLGIGALAGWIIYRDLDRRGWKSVVE